MTIQAPPPPSEPSHLACARSDVPTDGAVLTCRVQGRAIAVARRSAGSDDIVAFDTRCPHMDGPLRLGRVVEGEVICPWHFFRFDVCTGHAVACDKSQMQLKIYPVKVLDDKVYVDIQ